LQREIQEREKNYCIFGSNGKFVSGRATRESVGCNEKATHFFHQQVTMWWNTILRCVLALRPIMILKITKIFGYFGRKQLDGCSAYVVIAAEQAITSENAQEAERLRQLIQRADPKPLHWHASRLLSKNIAPPKPHVWHEEEKAKLAHEEDLLKEKELKEKEKLAKEKELADAQNAHPLPPPSVQTRPRATPRLPGVFHLPPIRARSCAKPAPSSQLVPVSTPQPAFAACSHARWHQRGSGREVHCQSRRIGGRCQCGVIQATRHI
jgi:hypothetical protein